MENFWAGAYAGREGVLKQESHEQGNSLAGGPKGELQRIEKPGKAGT